MKTALVVSALALAATVRRHRRRTWRPASSPSRNASPAIRSAKGPRTRSAPSSTASTAAIRAPRPVISYSDANKNSGIVWDEATFKEYIKDPRAKIPGTKMIFPGIKNETEVNNLWAYLKQFGPDGKKK